GRAADVKTVPIVRLCGGRGLEREIACCSSPHCEHEGSHNTDRKRTLHDITPVLQLTHLPCGLRVGLVQKGHSGEFSPAGRTWGRAGSVVSGFGGQPKTEAWGKEPRPTLIRRNLVSRSPKF